MRTYDCELLYRPETDEQRYLTEGPFACGNSQFSWVSIQHGEGSTVGSLNVFDLNTLTNVNHQLHGRPGFAFATDKRHQFVAGVERSVGMFDAASGEWFELCDGVDKDVAATIINDGMVFDGGLIFGSKVLQSKEKKAGLYLWRNGDQRLVQLRSDQLCSNGKVIYGTGNKVRFLDIDSPTKLVVQYDLDVEAGTLSDPGVVLDLRENEDFPDGMVSTPDGNSVIIAFWNPKDAAFGEARQYNLETGKCEAVWRTERSPQVSCPLLIEHDNSVKLVLTTAVEGMTHEKIERYPNAGCLFIGETSFDDFPESPVYQS